MVKVATVALYWDGLPVPDEIVLVYTRPQAQIEAHQNMQRMDSPKPTRFGGFEWWPISGQSTERGYELTLQFKP